MTLALGNFVFGCLVVWLFSYSVLQLGMAAFYNTISSVNDSSDSKSKCSTSAVAHHTNQHLEDGWGGRGMDFPLHSILSKKGLATCIFDMHFGARF